MRQAHRPGQALADSLRLRLFLMLAPAVAVVGLLFGGGLIFALMRSLNYMPAICRHPD